MTDKTWVRWMRLGAISGCHQLAERSFFVRGWQFPVCARCAGLPIGWLLAPLAALLWRPPLWVGPVFLLPMALDWSLQRFGFLPSNNIRRFATGVLGGFGYLLAIITIFLIIFGRGAYTVL